MDNAVALLLKQSQQGQLQGTFFGRLQSLAVVPAPEDEVPVNAVLRELCSLVRELSLQFLDRLYLRYTSPRMHWMFVIKRPSWS